MNPNCGTAEAAYRAAACRSGCESGTSVAYKKLVAMSEEDGVHEERGDADEEQEDGDVHARLHAILEPEKYQPNAVDRGGEHREVRDDTREVEAIDTPTGSYTVVRLWSPSTSPIMKVSSKPREAGTPSHRSSLCVHRGVFFGRESRQREHRTRTRRSSCWSKRTTRQRARWTRRHLDCVITTTPIARSRRWYPIAHPIPRASAQQDAA